MKTQHEIEQMKVEIQDRGWVSTFCCVVEDLEKLIK